MRNAIGIGINVLRKAAGGGGGGDTIPVITGVPTISGTATVGNTLTASPASVAGTPTPTRTWQWARDGVDIGGATSITYALVAADYGVTITVRQIETNVAGSDDATSAGTAIAWEPAALFQASEPGAIYDISDRNTVFTDTGGTTVAVVGDQVARINDVSGNGNHLEQATSGLQFFLARVPSGGRRNILTQTAALPTQSKTVTAAQHTLSFQGTGTVTLTGASTAGPLVGTGPTNIVSLTFTPSAGSLTLTVSGTVELAQLELGATRTVYQSVADAAGYDVTESGKADAYHVVVGSGDVLSSGASTQLVGPWEFWAKINMISGAGIGQAVFCKTLTLGSVHTGQASEGLFQRSDGVQRTLYAASRVDNGTSYVAQATAAFNYNSPVTAKAIAATGPDNLTITTPLSSTSAAPTFTGTPNAATSFRIGTSNAAATFHFYGGFVIDRNLTGPEATDADAWMDALINP